MNPLKLESKTFFLAWLWKRRWARWHKSSAGSPPQIPLETSPSVPICFLCMSLSSFHVFYQILEGQHLYFLMAGSVLSAGGSVPFEKALSSDWADMVDGFQRSALESRLGIPLIYGIDAVHGNNSVYGATIFPHNVGLGASRLAFFTLFLSFPWFFFLLYWLLWTLCLVPKKMLEKNWNLCLESILMTQRMQVC